MNDITSRQSWAIFCETKLDVRGAKLSMEQASNFIGRLKVGGESAQSAMKELESMPGVQRKGKATVKTSDKDWQALYDRAHAAGMVAGDGIVPVPMTVLQHANPLNDNSPIVRQYHVADGACGFAWVTIRPANCGFARWLKEKGLARLGYRGGMQVWVHQFNQSITRKEAYATAFAEVVKSAGIDAFADSRLD